MQVLGEEGTADCTRVGHTERAVRKAKGYSGEEAVEGRIDCRQERVLAGSSLDHSLPAEEDQEDKDYKVLEGQKVAGGKRLAVAVVQVVSAVDKVLALEAVVHSSRGYSWEVKLPCPEEDHIL